MANSNMTGKPGKNIFLKDLCDEAHVFVHANVEAVGHRNAGGLLSTMLQGKKTEESKTSYVFTWGEYPKDATLFFQCVAIVDIVNHTAVVKFCLLSTIAIV
jgi:hypothetical protein